jgi:hypothetical protein
MTNLPTLGELLVPTRHLERRALADFSGYSVDAKSAKAFGWAWAPCVLLVVVIILCCAAMGISILWYGKQFATDYAILVILPLFVCWFGCMYFHGMAARKRPCSLISGKEMAVYLRADSRPDEIVFIYVCHDSKTYFLKTIVSAYD